jgi:hypothetical protein
MSTFSFKIVRKLGGQVCIISHCVQFVSLLQLYKNLQNSPLLQMAIRICLQIRGFFFFLPSSAQAQAQLEAEFALILK